MPKISESLARIIAVHAKGVRFERFAEADCGVCGKRASDGEWFISGKRNSRGELPYQNFICQCCQREARDQGRLKAALNLWLARHGERIEE